MRGAALFARMSLTSLALRGAGIVVLPSTPAAADGGAGASNGIISGGAGGRGFAGNPGSPGSDASAGTDAAGGGGGGTGGGAGGRGCNSGLNAGGQGGAGGTSTAVETRDGSAGAAPTNGAAGGGGGGGGGGGYNANGTGAALTGGNGGNGGGVANTHRGEVAGRRVDWAAMEARASSVRILPSSRAARSAAERAASVDRAGAAVRTATPLPSQRQQRR